MTEYKITAKEHRANARKALGENIFSSKWLMALVVLLIYSAILSSVSLVISLVGLFLPPLSFASTLVTLLLTGPFMFGIASYFLSLSRNGSAKIESLFDGFCNDFSNNFLIALMTYIFTLLWSLLFFSLLQCIL